MIRSNPSQLSGVRVASSHAEPGTSRAIVIRAPGGVRLDLLIAGAMPNTSRTEVQRWIKEGAVEVAGRPGRGSERPAPGEMVRVWPPPTLPARMKAEAIPLVIVYEDDDLLVVDKPAGITVHPGAGTPSGTLANALLSHTGSLSVIGGEERPGIVHRLDRDTSGLLVVAKNDRTHRSLSTQIAARTATRRYRVIVWGNPAWNHATVRAAIGRDPHYRTRMAVVPDGEGRPAETILNVEERLVMGCVLTASLKTGRTHQIRVHCAYSHMPVVGDPVYGDHRSRCQVVKKPALRDALCALRRQALHAFYLSFIHPGTGERMEFKSAPPADWLAILEMMKDAGSQI